MKRRRCRINWPGLALRLFLAALLLPVANLAADIDQPPLDDAKSVYKQAKKEDRKGRFDTAEKLYRHAIELDPKYTDAKLSLAYMLAKRRAVREAYDISLAVAKAEPTNSRAYAVLGIALLTSGDFTNARLCFEKALTLTRKEDLAWAGMGLLDFYENKIEFSLANLEQAVYREPTEPDYLFALGQISARAEHYQESAEAYRRFLTVSNDMDTDRRERIKGLISFLTFLGTKTSLYDTGGAEQTSVPFQLIGNRPVIKVKINNSDDYLNFVLDTGSGISVISDLTAKRLGIGRITKGGFAKGIGGDGRFEIIYGFLRQVAVGDVQIRNVPVYIRKFHTTNENIDGYIGLSLISKFLTTIDYGKLTFDLQKRGTLMTADAVENNVSLPLRLTSSGFLSGEVKLEGIENSLNFIVDTGASVSVISDDLAGMQEVSRYVQNEKMRVIGSAGVTEDVPSFMLPRVTFGSHSRESVSAIALDLDLINESSGFQQAGILGGNFLRNYRLTFDFKNSKVIFVPIIEKK
jgi:cytochrome c-type biogenesis protein CcmH/NrfG/predicted aspartyl protease